MTAIFKRELRSYFVSPRAYAVIGIAVLFSGVLLTAFNLISLSPSLNYLCEEMKLIYAIITPVLASALISGEIKSGRYRLLFSLPVKSSRIVLGKYLAMMTVLLIPTVIIAVYPLILSLFGEVNLGEAYLSVLGLFVFQTAIGAICVFISSALKKTVTAAVISYILLVCLFGIDLLGALLPMGGSLGYFISTVSLFGAAESIGYGLFDYLALIYSALVTVAFLALSVSGLDKRRYE
ncbi:MAG: hypothetical protein E7641_01925 [Ruminococcaceae bacterium]|nr:hypothetical protein [Oscillospiraceae bacterium]